MPVLAHIPEDRFLEATRDNRNSGDSSTSGFVAVHYAGNTIDQPINTQFVCVRGVDLTSEFDEHDPRDNLAVLSRSDRHCTKWWPWTQGLPPSWHLQDLQMEELEQRRRAFEERMDSSRRAFDAQLDARSQATQRQMVFIAGLQVLIAVVAIFVAVRFTPPVQVILPPSTPVQSVATPTTP